MSSKKTKVDTLIVSDIHLGDRTTRSRELLELFDRYDFRRLILNGDILNGLAFLRLDAGHWRILARLRELKKDREVVWVHGNHDARGDILVRLLGIKVAKQYAWSEGGRRLLALHGHQYDRFLKENYLTSRLAYAVYNLLKDFDRENRIIDLIKKHSATWERSSLGVAEGALKHARRQGADAVISGHTHKIHAAAANGIEYYNTGSWNEKPSGYVVTKAGRVELKAVE